MEEHYTIRGQATVPDVKRIDLFDGSFKSGFRIKEIRIETENPLGTEEVSVRLTTEDTGHRADWNWGDNLEVGWAVRTKFYRDFFWVDTDCTVIEDLYLDPYSITDGDVINYSIILERVTMSGGMGAMNMVRNRSQG